MAPPADPAEIPLSLPPLPAKHKDFLHHVKSHPDTPMVELLTPYNDYDAVVRKLFAQEPSHPALQDNTLNILPLYGPDQSADVRIRARDLSSEPEELKQKYIMPLKDEDRKPNGSPAVVSTLKEFQTNFNLFCENSLSDLDWSNVVAAGSSVVTSLLPVPEEHRGSKRGLRQYYHETFAPASDVDLFLYGLTEEQAIEKIKQIEAKIKDSILYETTTIRTKNAITVVSQYPTRHVQIVLRIYKSIAEILTGFDVDCSCAAYDGQQVYLAPRALAAYITQTNHIDLSRRSPSYESRLSKYSHRGFEVFWPHLDRSRIDPTIFERSFGRTVGLARLLILEKLPKSSDRDAYLQQRREERGRPQKPPRYRYSRELKGNIKNDWEDEIAEWVEQDDVSDYHTFTIPYGEKFHARKIEKLLYTKDLLLNAEWNKPEDREVNLHRHPAFFGNAEDVIHDCCGSCPKPVTPEEEEVAEEESKIYVSGDITFIKDDPGRQAIGSFHPITETDWTEMAYVGNTSRLCQAIVYHDLEGVKAWLAEEDSDPNRRDYTGRTPLHLACMTSTPEIVQCLVDHGARLVSRLADGRTALHLAAARGSVEIVKILLTKSEENEAEEAKKDEILKEERRKAEKHTKGGAGGAGKDDDDELLSVVSDDSDAGSRSNTTGSFVKIGRPDEKEANDGNLPEDANEAEPDIYDINVLAWDNQTSPLHLAIVHGHVEVVEELVSSFGADVLLPIKLVNTYNHDPIGAILALVLALQLPLQEAKAMTAKLLQLGASSAQAEYSQLTPLHYFVADSTKAELLDVLFQHDEPAVKRAINHLAVSGWLHRPNGRSALMVAVCAKNAIGTVKLLDAGATPAVEFSDFVKAARAKFDGINNLTSEQNEKNFRQTVSQPVVTAVELEQPLIALELLARGADPNTLTTEGYEVSYALGSYSYKTGKSLLDCVQNRLQQLREYKGEKFDSTPPEPLDPDDNFYLNGLEDGTYRLWTAKRALKAARKKYDNEKREHDKRAAEAETREGLEEKKAAVEALIRDFEKLETALLAKNAKKFVELFPEAKEPREKPSYSYQPWKPKPFKISHTFQVPDLTDIRREGYMKLFEAAWRGDLTTIKSLTLSMWGPDNDQTPLQISVRDNGSFSPFTIAVLRGHLGVAKAILEIVRIQYQPKEPKGRERYNMRTDDDDTDNSDEELTCDDHGIRIYSEMIDDKFTIDDVGEVANQVKCQVTPLEVLSYSCSASAFIPKDERVLLSGGHHDLSPNNLVQYAIFMDNIDLLVYLLELGRKFSTTSDAEESSRIYTVSQADFEFAIGLSRLRCLTELIRRSGAGIRLDELVEKSGVEVKEKPKYYQGLSVYGKKRADWAAAGRGIRLTQPLDMHPPLLIAALKGSLNSVEWFLSTAPARYYTEFTATHKHDKRVKQLAQAKGGVEGSLATWLGSSSDLVLHCAVLSQETDESERMVKYLVQNVPSFLETQSADGYTPLSLAYALRRARFARILIEAGANQAVRDRNGNNLIHLLLWSPGYKASDEAKNLQIFLDLLDPLLVPSLLIERSSDKPGSLTPLAHWIHKSSSKCSPRNFRFRDKMNMNQESDRQLDILRVILDFAERTGQKHLELLDGAGNTPLHDAVRLQLPKMLELMLDRRPDLLYRENATGSTPADLAAEAWVGEVTSRQPRIPIERPSSSEDPMQESRPLVQRSPEIFVREHPKDLKTERRAMYELCCEKAEMEAGSGKRKRRLVSLFEANEVAKRLAAQQHANMSSRRKRTRRGYERDDDEEEKKKDVVAEWYWQGARW